MGRHPENHVTNLLFRENHYISHMSNRSVQLKKQLIKSLEEHLGIVSRACSAIGVSRNTYYDYIKNDPEFKQQVDELESISLDFAESQLHKRIEEGSDTAIIFFLKCKGRKRGYIEKKDYEGQLLVKTSNLDEKQIHKIIDAGNIN